MLIRFLVLSFFLLKLLVYLIFIMEHGKNKVISFTGIKFFDIYSKIYDSPAVEKVVHVFITSGTSCSTPSESRRNKAVTGGTDQDPLVGSPC